MTDRADRIRALSTVIEPTPVTKFPEPPRIPPALREPIHRFSTCDAKDAELFADLILDSKEFKALLMEFLTDTASIKGELEFFIQCKLENLMEQSEREKEWGKHE